MSAATVIEPCFRCDLPALAAQLRVPERRLAELAELARQAAAMARPRAVYRELAPAYAPGQVLVEGVALDSAQLCTVLDQAPVIHPFLATCGSEIAAWAAGVSGQVRGYWADALMQAALTTALDALEAHLGRLHGASVASVEPGMLRDWPVTEQTKIHALLGAAAAGLGVELNAQCMMTPLKSLSGLMFPVKEKLHKCALCANDHCRERRP